MGLTETEFRDLLLTALAEAVDGQALSGPALDLARALRPSDILIPLAEWVTVALDPAGHRHNGPGITAADDWPTMFRLHGLEAAAEATRR